MPEQALLDQYSLLHFAVGVLLFFGRFSFLLATLTHATFSLLYNNDAGYSFIKRYAAWWPGSKRADSYYNMLGDNLSFNAGWLVASVCDSWLATGDAKREWYETYRGNHSE
jgi:hypothetical protein